MGGSGEITAGSSEPATGAGELIALEYASFSLTSTSVQQLDQGVEPDALDFLTLGLDVGFCSPDLNTPRATVRRGVCGVVVAREGRRFPGRKVICPKHAHVVRRQRPRVGQGPRIERQVHMSPAKVFPRGRRLGLVGGGDVLRIFREEARHFRPEPVLGRAKEDGLPEFLGCPLE
jgi:hypothetical protein